MNPLRVENGPLALCHADCIHSKRGTEAPSCGRNTPEESRQADKTVHRAVTESTFRPLRTAQRLTRTSLRAAPTRHAPTMRLCFLPAGQRAVVEQSVPITGTRPA